MADVAIILVFAAPLRSGLGVLPLGLGVLCGGTIWWLWFALFHTDLLSRNDQYFTVLVAMIPAVILGKALLGPSLLRFLARRDLRREPRASALLRLARAIMLGPERGHLCRDQHHWWHWLFQTYNWARCSLRIGPSRSCAIEKAIEDGIDYESSRLRRLLDMEAAGTPPIADQADRAAAAGAAYLELVAIMDETALSDQVSESTWMRRFLAVWDLIRFAERIQQKEFSKARAELLLGVERLSSPIPILFEMVRAARSENPRFALIRRVSEKVAGNPNLSEQLAALLLADLLVDLEHATWALGLVDEMVSGGVVEWMHPTLERIRLRAEQQILRHEVSLEASDIFARYAQCEHSAVIADAPLCSRAITNISASRFNVTRIPPRRGTRGLPAIARPLFDPGPGRGFATASLLAITIFAAILVTTWVPFGQALKPLADLHRQIDYHEHPLTSVAINPNDRSLLITSLGGGLHHVDTHTFRIRTERPDNGGPSTNFLTDVAVSEEGRIAVLTADGAKATASGLDVQSTNGWKRLISPQGVSGLSAKEISFIGANGADKVLLAGSRVLRYRTAQRELTELIHDNQGPPIHGRIVAVASSPTDANRLWVAAGEHDQPSTRVLELSLRDDGRYSTQDITGNALPTETIKHLATGADRLWASTETGRLYQYDDKRWKLRIDGDTGLDLGAVRYAIVGAGDPPALWLTDRAASGEIRSIRARILPSQGILPSRPWRRVQLGAGNVPRSPDLRLGDHDGTPAAWFDTVRQEHVLAVPGRNGGLWCFRASLELPESVDQATLKAEQILTPGERICSIDHRGQKLVCLLETLNGTQRRLAIESIDAISDGLESATVVQQSVMPDENVFGGARILSLRHQQAEKRFDLLTDRGRILTYDLSRHGLTTSSGTQLVDRVGAPIGPLRSVDSDDGKLVAVDEQSRLVEVVLPSRLDEENALPAKILFEPSKIAPSVNLEPVKVATEPDGIDILMAEPGSTLGVPWRLKASSLQNRENGAGSEKRSLVEWVPLPVEKPLQIASLTRLQDGGRIGPQLATDQSGQLLWRDTSGWKKVEKSLAGGTEIVPAVGATFGQDSEGLKRIALTAQGPVLVEALWTTPPSILRFPITAIAAMRGANPQKSPVCVVVGHAGGLAQYDLTSRKWRALVTAAATNWSFISTENEQGVCEHIWAIKIENGKTISQAILVKGDQADIVANSEIAEARGAGNSLGLLFSDGHVAVATPDRVIKTLVHEKSSAVGDAKLRRLALADRIYSIDTTGRLLSATKDTLQWRVEDQLKEGVPYRDLETTSDGALLLVSDDGKVLRHTQGRTQELGVFAHQVERLDTAIAAADIKTGRLEVLDRQGLRSEILAGGRSPAVQIGDHVIAALSDGDDLFIAGPSGAVWRDPNQRRSIPVLNGDLIDRFEKLGPHRIAWKKTQPFLLTVGAAPKLTKLGDPGTEVVLAPDSTLWISDTKNGVTRLKPVNGANTGLFDAESLLGNKVTQAAPLSDGHFVLQGKFGELLIYEAAKRRIRQLANANELPSEWRFAIIAKQVFIISSSAKQQDSVYRVDSNPIALRLLEKNASRVVEYSNGLAWFDDTGSLRHIDAQGKDQILIRLPLKQRSADAALQVTQVLAGDDNSLWVHAGSTAFEYRVKEGGVAQQLSNVNELVRVGTQAAAIRKSPNTPKQLIALGAKLNLLASAFEGARGGADSVLTWRSANGTLSIEHLGDDAKVYQKSVTLLSRLASNATNRIAAADSRKLFCRTDQGVIVAYDVIEGGWSTLPKLGAGWEALGQMGELIIAKRQTAAGADVMTLKPSGQLQDIWNVPGTAWFLDNGFIGLIRDGNNVVRIVKQHLDGSTELIGQYNRLSVPFAPERSFVVESKSLKAALVRTSDAAGKSSEIFVVRADQSATRLAEIKLPPLLTKLQVFTQSGEFLFLDSGNCLVRINATSGETKVGTEMFDGLGVLGEEVVTIRRTMKPEPGVSIYRLRDGKDIGSLLSEEDRGQLSRVTEFQFVVDRTRQLLTVKMGDGVLEQPGTGNNRVTVLSLSDDNPRFENIATTDLLNKSSQLPLQYGRTGMLPVMGRRLDQDGWFADHAVLKIAAKSINSDLRNVVPLEMRDGQRISLPIKNNISTAPPEGLGGFALIDGELRSKDGQIRFGRIVVDGMKFACDAWVDALPFKKSEFFSLDQFGQLWRWTDSDGTLTRQFVAQPTSVRTSRARRMALTAEDNSALVLLDEKSAPFARILPDGKVDVVNQDVATIDSPAQRSGQWGPIAWERTTDKTTKRSSHIMSLVISDGSSKSTMPIHMTSSGLNVDTPVGLKAIEDDKQPWLHLGRAADGREVVCPPIADSRLLQMRLVSKFSPALKPVEFRSGSFQFVPRDDSWEVQIDGKRIDLVSGRLAVDTVLGATSVLSAGGTELFLRTAQPRVLVRQRWGRDMALGMPELFATPGEIRSLRTWRGELVVQTTDSNWYSLHDGQWTPTAPEWQATVGEPSRWKFSPDHKVLNWSNQPIPLLNGKAGFALASDVVTEATESDGAPKIRQGPNGDIVFTSASGDWLSWRQGQIVAVPTEDVPPRVSAEIELLESRIRVPKRGGDDGVYRLMSEVDSSAALPMKLVDGRLPHHQAEKLLSWDKDGLQVQLASKHGNWSFDGQSLREGKSPLFSTAPIASPNTSPDYDRHVAIELRKDRWLRWTQQDRSWQFEFAASKSATSADAVLGSLTESGFPIDNPAEVRPLELRDDRIRFAFRSQLWSRSLANSIVDFAKEGELPFGPQTAPGLDLETGRCTLLAREVMPNMADPMLGVFSPDGRYDAASSAVASVQRTDLTLALRLQQRSPALLDFEVLRDGTRWKTPFENPRGVLERDQRLLVLNEEGTSLGVWDRTGRLFGLVTTNARITAFWRQGNRVFARQAMSDEESVVELREQDNGLPQVVPVDLPDNETAITTDAFAVRRSFQDGHFDIVSQVQGQDDWQVLDSWASTGFPGSRVDVALWLSDNALACQDGLGIRQLELTGRGYSRLHWPLSNVERPSMFRHAGHIIYGQTDSQIVVCVEGNSEGPRFTPPGEESGIQRIADWQVQQSGRDRPVSLQATDSKDRPILLGDATSAGQKPLGALLIDRVQLLGNFKAHPALVLPAGVQWLDEHGAFLEAGEEVRAILANGNLRVLGSPKGDLVLVSDHANDRAIHVDQLLHLGSCESEAVDSLYIGEDDDWRVFRNNDQELVLERPVATIQGRQVDHIKGDDIFSNGGQLSFDSVLSVAQNPDDGSTLLISTERAVEVVRFTPNGPVMQVSQLGKVEFQQRKDRNSLSVSWDGEAEMNLKFGDQLLHLSVPPKRKQGHETSRSNWSLPRAIQAGRRAWIVEPTGVHWVETDDRWIALRRKMEVER
ncbi:hypothetical protein [Schlesneria sp. DSM 10557]|uniref:hypothetical protein n=1 Tax=Schlesneria sp. DSM 10557 TaxID=3044399 RepID=UPI0035A0781A